MGKSSPGVTMPQYRALVELSSRGPQSLVSLAQLLGMPVPGASRLCDRLVGKGLVDKSQSPTSGRSIVLSVSDKGAALAASILDERRAELRALLAGLPARQRRNLRESLNLVAAALGEERHLRRPPAADPTREKR